MIVGRVVSGWGVGLLSYVCVVDMFIVASKRLCFRTIVPIYQSEISPAEHVTSHLFIFSYQRSDSLCLARRLSLHRIYRKHCGILIVRGMCVQPGCRLSAHIFKVDGLFLFLHQIQFVLADTAFYASCHWRNPGYWLFGYAREPSVRAASQTQIYFLTSTQLAHRHGPVRGRDAHSFRSARRQSRKSNCYRRIPRDQR